ncbi:hypothetical protein QBC42DRAFT_261652 [Cladorrhinum samala]|uniref:G domain-containing protein n=1 Tax=Cladorrhinum samala TaxID=585594 RepID=A0AAV9HXE0_9PEZI|nr:hypothetical protein QBC42DRAFT_261652 [Cladorrhinum samala]
MKIRLPKEAPLILVIGGINSGKSGFVNYLHPDGEGARSATGTQPRIIPLQMGQELVYVVDTPELDIATRSENDIFEEMTRFLGIQHETGCKLRGVIFVHPITQPTAQGSEPTCLRMFQELCGVEASGSLTVLTTRWDEVDIYVGSQRHQELLSALQGAMTGCRTRARKFHPPSASLAQSLVGRVFNNEDVVLEIQKDVMSDDKALSETAAGRFVIGKLNERLCRINEDMATLTKGPGRLAGSDNSDIEGGVLAIIADLQANVASRRRLGIAIRDQVQRVVREKTRRKLGPSKSSIQRFSDAVGWSIAAATQKPTGT